MSTNDVFLIAVNFISVLGILVPVIISINKTRVSERLAHEAVRMDINNLKYQLNDMTIKLAELKTLTEQLRNRA